jgi:hypothetical protein
VTQGLSTSGAAVRRAGAKSQDTAVRASLFSAGGGESAACQNGCVDGETGVVPAS